MGRVAVTVRAVVINIHHHGATVRLEDGSLAAIPSGEFAANRPAYITAYEKKTPLVLTLTRTGRHPSATFAEPEATATAADAAPAPPPTHGPGSPGPGAIGGPAAPILFEERMGEYLKATLEWAPADRPDPAQRHFIRKKRRAALFEARNKPT